MRVLILGATGMVGQGVLLACLADPRVASVLCVGRAPTGRSHPKLAEYLVPDLAELGGLADRLAGLDACLFCAGVSSLGRAEQDYTRLTYDLTLAVARAVVSPALTFIYVSGAGTDSSGKGRVMWARVKGRTENALLALPFKAAYMFRPGAIQPLHGVVSRTRWLRLLYAATRPAYPLLVRLFPGAVTTSEQVGRAMIAVAADGYPARVLETADINRLV